jgi:hypothetical protein
VNAAQRPDPVDDLRHYVHRFTGSQPLDCGQHRLVQQGADWMAADERALQKSVECGLAAASAKRTFWTFNQDRGIDSTMLTGILGTSEGIIYRFSYDSDPCGGSGCPSRISFERCDRPVARTIASGRSEFWCSR